METTSRFQSRLLSSAKRSRRRQNPLSLLNKMKELINQRLINSGGKLIFVGTRNDIISLCNYLFLTAGLLEVDLGLAVRRKYPRFCPYCMQNRCQCEPVKSNTHRRWDGPIPEEGTIYDLQEMLSRIYPPERHTLEYQKEKLLEEIEEAEKAIRESLLIEVQEELADIFARLSPLADTLKIPLI